MHSGASQLEEHNQHSWNSTSRFVVPRCTIQPRKEHDTEDTRESNEEDGEDGVEHEDEEDDCHGGARLMKQEHDVNDA